MPSPLELFNALIYNQDFMNVALAVVLVGGLFIIGYLVNLVRTNEKLSKYMTVLKLVKDRAEELFLMIYVSNMDMTNVDDGAGGTIDYVERSEASTDIYGRKIDPRMLYVLDELEKVFAKHGVKYESDILIPRAEAWFQRLRHEDNGLILNDNDIPASQGAAAQTASTAQKNARSEAQRARREREAQSAVVAVAVITPEKPAE